MACTECNAELSADELGKKIKCDDCSNVFCQACSGISVTEIRVMQLAKRKLKFICHTCQSKNVSNDEQFHRYVDTKLTTAIGYFTSLIDSLKIHIDNSVSQTKSEVIMLRESNIELVNLLTNASNVNPPITNTVSSNSSLLKSDKTSKLITSKDVSNKSYANSVKKGNTSNKISRVPHPSSSSDLVNHKPQTEATSKETIPNSNPHKTNFAKQPTANWDSQFKRKHRNITLGSRDVNHKFHGKTANKKIWLFITKVPDDVNAEDIKNYIETQSQVDSGKIKHPETDSMIEVKQLATNNSRSNNKSFMVGVAPELSEEVYKPCFWPVNIAFERFNFRRGQHFLRSTSHSDNTSSWHTPNSFLAKQKD